MRVQVPSKKVITFRTDPDVQERLAGLSKETNRTVSFYINSLLEEHLGELEHAYGLRQDAEQARSGKAKTYSLDSIKAELDL
ncbi:hypothetical protein [Rothia sp. CCM 9419]|uniref:type II toxin-antitoxin system RelB family antitoxin n=1 Tax=Rothia sp. CCM 9419 TaxID=3402662 RepID=UPI003AE0BB2A